MMDVLTLTNELTKDPNKVIKILEKLGCEKIKYDISHNYITSTRPEIGADNPLGQIVYLDNLNVHQNTRSYSGNIYTLTMDVKHLNFPQTLDIITMWCNISQNRQHIKHPFNSFYKNISKSALHPELVMKKYSESNLPPSNILSMKYIKDGVSATAQEYFGVRLDTDNNAIITPIHDFSGNLVGAKARSNDPNCDKAKRFWAFLEYQKTLTLFGYIQNYKSIVSKKKVFIVEAEKSVMIAHDWGMTLLLGIGGHTISSTQAKYIKSLCAEKIYIAFDEGVSEDEIVFNAKKLIVDNAFYKNKVGYIFDNDNSYLQAGSKDSPFDNGKDTFIKLYKEKTKWL